MTVNPLWLAALVPAAVIFVVLCWVGIEAAVDWCFPPESEDE